MISKIINFFKRAWYALLIVGVLIYALLYLIALAIVDDGDD